MPDAPWPASFVDMHVHPALPWVGAAWRRRIHRFRSPALGDGSSGVRTPAQAPTQARIYGAAFYVTYLLRPSAARRALLLSLEAFRARVGAVLLASADLPSATSATSVSRAASAENTSGEACFMAVESMRCLRDPGDVRRLWDLGVRSLQPIHFLDTPWGGSSREGLLPSSRTGVTGLGREMLAEMAGLGLILDLAHMSLPNAEQCLAAYPGPVMCSHTGLSSIRSTARNITPDLAREVFRRGGLVGVTCWRHLLGANPPRIRKRGNSRSAWTDAYCETVSALAELDPRARVAVGSDRGAPIHAPAWFYASSHLAEITATLSHIGWTPDRILGFFSGNALDFLGASLPAFRLDDSAGSEGPDGPDGSEGPVGPTARIKTR